VDSILIPVQALNLPSARLFSRNKFNLFSFYDADHGDGDTLLEFANKIVDNQNLKDHFSGEIWLLTQPRIFGYVFNPVSFWFFLDSEKQLRVVLAEVNNTFKGRHFYVCRHDDFSPIKPKDKIQVEKLFHVSPFQDVSGTYDFKFQFESDRVGAWIDFKNGDQGVYATQTGTIQNLTNLVLVKSALLRPFGALRIMTLIHWQALKLKLKGGAYRKVPPQKEERISR